MEGFWNSAIAIGGLASIGAFVFWSLYKHWLNLPIFSRISDRHTFIIMLVFLGLTFLSVIVIVVADAWKRNDTGTKHSDVQEQKSDDLHIGQADCDKRLIPNLLHRVWHKGPDVNASEQIGELVIKEVIECTEGKCFRGVVTFPDYSIEPDTINGSWRNSKITFQRIVMQLHRRQVWKGTCLPSSIRGEWNFADNPDDYGSFTIDY